MEDMVEHGIKAIALVLLVALIWTLLQIIWVFIKRGFSGKGSNNAIHR